MSKKKEKLLKKYLDKKNKQRKRDEILAQIAELERKNPTKQKQEKKTKRKRIFGRDLTQEADFEEKVRFNDKLKGSYEENENLCENNNIEIFSENVNSEHDSSININSHDQNPKNDVFNDGKKASVAEKEKHNFLNQDIEKNNLEFLQISTENNIDTINRSIFTSDQFIESNSENYLENSSGDSDLDSIFDFYEKVTVNRTKEIEDFRKTLPVFYEQNEIISKIKNNFIILIKGKTGCGKSTQIPQFLYEAGFAKEKMIGITQPRRLAAIGLSYRISTELNNDVTSYQIRYDNNITKNTKLKIMTDGILLKEIQEDFLLSKYSVIILDEIHERNVNMDILLPLLKKIIKLRIEKKDKLTLILMSASNIDQDIINYFDKIKIIDVSSNSHKVSIFYDDKISDDIITTAHIRIKKILKIKAVYEKNAILVFLPSKVDIFKLKNILMEDSFINENCVVLPLFSSLSKDEQNLIYKDFEKRKIILSTNIAETSLTIPDVYFVIDSGLVKNKIVNNGIVEYSIDYISQSSAQQRAGRAGRTGPGICYRLYTGQIYNNMNENNVPKIFYEPLENVFLDLINLGIHNLRSFPFINKPSDEKIEQSINRLIKLNILTKNIELTQIGKILSHLPLSPRIGKLLCVASTKHILPELIDLACIMSTNIEMSRNENTKKYYVNEKSDLIVILKIFRDFLKNKKKLKIDQNISLFEEVVKMSNFIRKKFNLDCRNDLTYEIKNKLCYVLFCTFKDQIGILYDGSYYYRNKEVRLSNNSVDVDEDYVIFEYLVKGTKNVYMKNITILEKEWFNTK